MHRGLRRHTSLIKRRLFKWNRIIVQIDCSHAFAWIYTLLCLFSKFLNNFIRENAATFRNILHMLQTLSNRETCYNTASGCPCLGLRATPFDVGKTDRRLSPAVFRLIGALTPCCGHGLRHHHIACYTSSQKPPLRGIGSESRCARVFTGPDFRVLLWNYLHRCEFFCNHVPIVKPFRNSARIGSQLPVGAKYLVWDTQTFIACPLGMRNIDCGNEVAPSKIKQKVDVFLVKVLSATLKNECFDTLALEIGQQDFKTFTPSSLLLFRLNGRGDNDTCALGNLRNYPKCFTLDIHAHIAPMYLLRMGRYQLFKLADLRQGFFFQDARSEQIHGFACKNTDAFVTPCSQIAHAPAYLSGSVETIFDRRVPRAHIMPRRRNKIVSHFVFSTHDKGKKRFPIFKLRYRKVA